MVQTVTLELSALNNIPGVSGVEDVEFDIPEVDDLEDVVDDLLDDLEDELTDRLDDLPTIDSLEEEVDRAIDEIIDDIPTVDLDPDQIVDDLTEAFEDAIQDITLDPEQIAEDISEDIEDALPAQVLNTEEVAQEVLDGLSGQFDVEAVDPEEIAQSVLDEVDDLEVGGPQVDVQGVFGPLTEDVVRAFNEVLDQRVQAPDVDIPNVEDIRNAVSEEVESLLQDLPGSDLLFNPDQFIDEQIARLTDNLVDDDAREELEDALEEVA